MKVPLAAVEFAARRCSEYVSVQEHEDIDIKETEHIWDHQWDQFLTWYYHLAHENARFMIATDSQKKVSSQIMKTTMYITQLNFSINYKYNGKFISY